MRAASVASASETVGARSRASREAASAAGAGGRRAPAPPVAAGVSLGFVSAFARSSALGVEANQPGFGGVPVRGCFSSQSSSAFNRLQAARSPARRRFCSAPSARPCATGGAGIFKSRVAIWARARSRLSSARAITSSPSRCSRCRAGIRRASRSRDRLRFRRVSSRLCPHRAPATAPLQPVARPRRIRSFRAPGETAGGKGTPTCGRPVANAPTICIRTYSEHVSKLLSRAETGPAKCSERAPYPALRASEQARARIQSSQRVVAVFPGDRGDLSPHLPDCAESCMIMHVITRIDARTFAHDPTHSSLPPRRTSAGDPGLACEAGQGARLRARPRVRNVRGHDPA